MTKKFDVETIVLEQMLTPARERVPVTELRLPQLPLVAVNDATLQQPEYRQYAGVHFVLLGAIAQQPGHVLVFSKQTGMLTLHTHELEMLTLDEA